MNSNLKSKLFAALAMVLIASIMLGTASFAWFTISTTPEISNIKTTVVTNENLEIVLDNGYTAQSIPKSDKGDYNDPYTWGNLLDLEVANTAHNFKLVPVQMDGDSFNYPTYGFDGRIKSMNSLEKVFISDHEDYESVSGGYAGYLNPNDEAEAIGITYWLRSNEDCDIILARPNTYRADDGENAPGNVNAVKGKGSTITFDFSEEVDEAKALAVNVDNAYKDWAASQTEENEKALLAAEQVLKNSLSNDIDMEFYFYARYKEGGKWNTLRYDDATSAMEGYKINEKLTTFKLYYIGYDRIYEMLKSLHVIFQVINNEGTIEKTLYGSAMYGVYYLPDDWASISSIEKTPNIIIVDPYRELYGKADGNKYYRARGEMLRDKGTSGILTVNLAFSTLPNIITNESAYKLFYDTFYTDTSSWPDSLKSKWLAEEVMPVKNSIPSISLTANQPQKIQSYIYLDGTTATNAVALTFQDTGVEFNIQFWNPECMGHAMTVKDSSTT